MAEKNCVHQQELSFFKKKSGKKKIIWEIFTCDTKEVIIYFKIIKKEVKKKTGKVNVK